MIQRFIHRILLRRHFWRHATFSEVAELYVAKMLRMVALYLAAGFISIYLYENGFSIFHIALFWACFYTLKSIISLPLASLVAYIGPKRGILIANIMYIPAMVGFAMLPTVGPMILILVLVCEAISATLYSISHNVNFSKVKSLKFAGKEIAYMHVIEKATAAVSPLIGGVIALFFGPEVVIIIAAVIFLLAALPLLASGENVKTKQRLRIKTFPWRLLRRHAAGQFSYGFDTFTSGNAWSMYLAAVILVSQEGNTIYLVAGILSSVVLVVSIAASYIYGKLVDTKHGKLLMNLSSLGRSLTHITRSITGNTVGVAGVNVANEITAAGYMMPYTRAVYDNADLSGRRIAYAGLNESISNIGAALAAVTLAFLSGAFTEPTALKMMFLTTAAVVLLGLTNRFPIYRRQ